MEETEGDSFRICLCGPESVGKTALLLRFLNGEYEATDDPTIENSHTANLVVDNKQSSLDILDTGGNNAYNYLHEKWFSWPDAFLVMFSVTAKYSFELIPYFLKKIESVKNTSRSVILLVGTQNDDERPRQTTKEQAMELAYHYNCNYLETSAKEGLNVHQTFQQLVRELRTKKKENEILSSIELAKDKKAKRVSLVPTKFKSKEKRQEREKKKEEERNVQLDSALSILKESDKRKHICKVIPKLKVVPLKTKMEVATVIGPPEDESTQSYKEYVSARTVSTYPKKAPDSSVREGDPIADQYYLTHFENRTVVAVADGCNWGVEVKLAAGKASRVFVEYMKKHQKEIKTTREVGYIILRAFMAAHNSIIEGRTVENIFQAGTTTMLAGMVLELDEPVEEKWGFVFVGLGDCKAYHWSCKTGKVTDITVGNRGNIVDARDPGGRLGPYLEGGLPDLRNLTVYWCQCSHGDIISIVTDGVHDNMDPQHLGKLPNDLNIKVKDNSWSELDMANTTPLYVEADKVKSLFAHKFVNAMIGGEKSLLPETRTTPSVITHKFIEHAMTVTKAGREFMEQNPGKKLPKDYVKYPGKMDHATCVSFEVGSKKSEKEPPNHKKTNTDPSLYWEEYKTEDGEKYFYNTVTKKSTWEDPFRKMQNSDWKAYYDEDGEVYYYNTLTHECSWEIPEGL